MSVRCPPRARRLNRVIFRDRNPNPRSSTSVAPIDFNLISQVLVAISDAFSPCPLPSATTVASHQAAPTPKVVRYPLRNPRRLAARRPQWSRPPRPPNSLSVSRNICATVRSYSITTVLRTRVDICSGIWLSMEGGRQQFRPGFYTPLFRCRIPAMDRNLCQMMILSRPQASLAYSPLTRARESEPLHFLLYKMNM